MCGHGGAVLELARHPHLPSVFLSASEDRSVRLWCIERGGCVAVFGGVLGHRDQVLSVDWHRDGRRFASGGVDGQVKIWRVPEDTLGREARALPRWFASDGGRGPLLVAQPVWSTSAELRIHTGYVDCVRWWGEEVLSKSVDGEIVRWLPIYEEGDAAGAPQQRRQRILGTCPYPKGSIWFTRFTVHAAQARVVWGNDAGQLIYCSIARNGALSPPVLCPAPKKAPGGMPLRSVAIVSSGRSIVSGGQDGVLRLWSGSF